jgi:hypothetical protein
VHSNVRRFLEAIKRTPLLIACIAHGEHPVFKGHGEPSNKSAFEVFMSGKKEDLIVLSFRVAISPSIWSA